MVIRMLGDMVIANEAFDLIVSSYFMILLEDLLDNEEKSKRRLKPRHTLFSDL